MISWLDDGSWRMAPIYKRDGGIRLIAAYHPIYQIHLTVIEREHIETIGFHRQLFIRNEHAMSQSLQVLFHHFPSSYSETNNENLSFYAPISKALIHSNGTNLLTTFAKGNCVDHFECAVGKLSFILDEQTGNLISQTFSKESSESIMAKKCIVPANAEYRVDQWLHQGLSIDESECFMRKFHCQS